MSLLNAILGSSHRLENGSLTQSITVGFRKQHRAELRKLNRVIHHLRTRLRFTTDVAVKHRLRERIRERLRQRGEMLEHLEARSAR